MKRRLSFLLILVLILGTAALTACGGESARKRAISGGEFESQMESAGFTVYNITDQYDYTEAVVEVLIAKAAAYQIEFYDMATADDAITAFDANKEDFKSASASKSSEAEVSFGNGARYAVTASGMYMLVSRVGNTFLYLNVPEQYKNEVVGLVKDLGY